MKAILLVNMGSPTSEKEMKSFLKQMFMDKSIISAPYLIRVFLSNFISHFRHNNSWKKYELIGGSPLLSSMNQIRNDLSKQSEPEHKICCAYSYSEPFISTEIERLSNEGIKEITVLSMYPQASFSTTGSIKREITKAQKKHPELSINIMDEYYSNPNFISFWTNLIDDKINEVHYSMPYLLFSAHAIPEYQIKKGDTYTKSIEKTAILISNSLNIPYSISYQSKMGRIKWASPDTKEHLSELQKRGINEILIIPISFLNENLETLYDLDIEIIPYAKQLGINKIDRVKIPKSHHILTRTFLDLIKQ